jgi:ATP-binding protein involved in chromosome partitioning
MNITEKKVKDALSKVIEPELHKDLISLKMVEQIKIDENNISFTVVLTTPACPLKHQIEAECKASLRKHLGEGVEVSVNFSSRVRGNAAIEKAIKLKIRNIIAVGSGKGGVGKSTVSANLAVSLAASGAKVGLLDADLYGPNLPMIMGLSELPPYRDDILVPGEIHGVKLISLGFLVPDGEAVIWRGPMLHSTLRNLLTQVEWGELDYLIVDLPPGTGDVQLSLAQSVAISGAVIVSSPQNVALSDAVRGISAFRKLDVPILGLVENMAGDAFGSGGGEKAASELDIPFLGRIHLDPDIRIGGDSGKPAVLNRNAAAAVEINAIAGKIAAGLSVMISEQAVRQS